MRTEVTTWYLEMLQPDQLQAAPCPRADVRVERAAIPSPELSRFLYTAVGGMWYWLDRLSWDYARWLDYLNRAEVETLVLHVSGTPAGYIELEAQPNDNVEVASFGLLPRFIAQRLGGYLLSVGVPNRLGGGCAAGLGAHVQPGRPDSTGELPGARFSRLRTAHGMAGPAGSFAWAVARRRL